jgi:histidine triad (HIT) family protein
MPDCIFCQIAKKKIPTKIEKQTSNLIVFKDINPQASVHLLIVPKKHIRDIGEVSDKLWLEIKKIALELAHEKKLTGFRLVTNMGSAAAVKHMHVHFLGGVDQQREV